MPHVCVSELGQHWFRKWLVAYSAPSHYLTSAVVLSIGSLGTNMNEILITIQKVSFTKMHLKILSVKQRPFCPGVDELTDPRAPMCHQVISNHSTMTDHAEWRGSWFPCRNTCAILVFHYDRKMQIYFQISWNKFSMIRVETASYLHNAIPFMPWIGVYHGEMDVIHWTW